jgi:hypothetical protein
MAVDLGKQVGPLPLGAWIAVVAGGLGLAWYSTRMKTGEPEIVDDTSGTPGVGTGAVSSWLQNTAPDTDADVAGKITTNEEWGRAAVNHLIALRYDEVLADSAIRKYLNGNDPKPSVGEFALQRMALARFGSPPYPLPPSVNDPPTSTSPPVTTPTTPKPNPTPPAKGAVKYYYVKAWPAKGSTLSGIAEISYGHASRWPDIYNANRAGQKRADGTNGMISNPNLLHPGWKLVIP